MLVKHILKKLERPLKSLPAATQSMAGRLVQPPSPDEISIVVRHVEERTRDTCAALLKEALPGVQLRLVSSVPFDACLRLAYEASLEMDTPWSLHVDADMLCAAVPLYGLIEYAKLQRDNVFAFSGLAMDRFFMVPRGVGLHLYRTSLLKDALSRLAPQGTTSRPETSVKQAMAKRGYPTIQTNFLIALHDYEQHYRHIFRKICLIQKKFANSKLLLPHWEFLAETIPDFAVAANAAKQDIPFSLSLNDREIQKWCALHVMLPPEKKALEVVQYTQKSVSAMLSEALATAKPELSRELFPQVPSSWTYQLAPVYPEYIEKAIQVWDMCFIKK